MTIEKALLTPKHLHKEQVEQIAASAALSEMDFRHLLKLMSSENVTLGKRAAWCFSLAAKLKPDWTDTCQAELVALLDIENPTDALLRNTLRILRDCTLRPDLYDKTAYYCFELVQDPGKAIAIRAFALHILGQIGRAVPEIRPEVRAIIEYHFEDGAAGLTAAARNVLTSWAKMEKSEK